MKSFDSPLRRILTGFFARRYEIFNDYGSKVGDATYGALRDSITMSMNGERTFVPLKPHETAFSFRDRKISLKTMKSIGKVVLSVDGEIVADGKLRVLGAEFSEYDKDYESPVEAIALGHAIRARHRLSAFLVFLTFVITWVAVLAIRF